MLRRNPRTTLWMAGITVGVALLILLVTHWNPYKKQCEAFAPLFTPVAGLSIAGVTLMRHFAQTEADRQRRITESFSKAVEQLASQNIAVRLGGIYTLMALRGCRPILAAPNNALVAVRAASGSYSRNLAHDNVLYHA